MIISEHKSSGAEHRALMELFFTVLLPRERRSPLCQNGVRNTLSEVG